MKQFIFIGALFSCLCANAQRQEICFHRDKTLIPIYADQLTDSVSCQIYQDFEQEDHVYEAFNVPAELLIYPDENHWVLKPQNGVLWQRTFFEWLDKWLKPAKQ